MSSASAKGATVIFGVLLSGWTCLAFPPSKSSFTVHNFMPEFWKFWAAAQGQSIDRQAQLWQDIYVKPHRMVYGDLVKSCKDEFDPEWARAKYFPDLPKLVPAMHAMADSLPQQLTAAQRRFLQMFPDMRWAGDIYVLASGHCFNARAQTIQGRSAVLFGVDDIVALGQRDLTPVIEHELFHRYHHEFFDFEVSSGYPLWTVLWAEGLAQYVCEQLNPAASEIDLSLVPLGMAQTVDDRKAEIAADFLRRFDSTDENDSTVYFSISDHEDPLVPARAGYELGVLVVRELSKHNSIRTMAHWSQQEAKPQLHEALSALAGASQ
jgi:hypothetical protein